MPTYPAEVFLFVHVPKTGGSSLVDAFERHLELGRDFIHLGSLGRDRDHQLGLPPFHERSPEERGRARVVVGHEVNVTTHRLIPGKEPRYVAILRQPAARLVSAYNFEMFEFYQKAGKAPLEFDQWYRKQERDVMIKFLAKRVLASPLRRREAQLLRYAQYATSRGSTRRLLHRVNRALEGFWFVGTTESLDQAAPLILTRIGVGMDIGGGDGAESGSGSGGGLERRLVSGKDFEKRLKLDSALLARLHRDNALDVQLWEQWNARSQEGLARLAAEAARGTWGRR